MLMQITGGGRRMRARVGVLRRSLAIAALAGTALLASGGSAIGAEKLVLSASIVWKGTFDGSGNFTSTVCKFRPAGGGLPTTCVVTGQAQGIGTSSVNVGFLGQSADSRDVEGRPMFAGRVSSKPPLEKYAGTGSCIESEEEKTPRACVAKVRLSFNTRTGTASGAITVKEPTAAR
jgi:hypothetical protein